MREGRREEGKGLTEERGRLRSGQGRRPVGEEKKLTGIVRRGREE